MRTRGELVVQRSSAEPSPGSRGRAECKTAGSIGSFASGRPADLGPARRVSRRDSTLSIAVTLFGKFSRLTRIARDDTVCARQRTRSDTVDGTALAGRCWGSVSRRFDVVSPVVGLLATTVRFAEFQSTGPDRYGAEKGSRSVYARRRVEPADRIPPATMNPQEQRAASGGSSFGARVGIGHADAARVYSSTFFASTSSGTLPPSTRVSLNALTSYFAVSVFIALSRCRRISVWPTL